MEVMLSWYQDGKPMTYTLDFQSPLAAGDLIRYADLMKKAESEDVHHLI